MSLKAAFARINPRKSSSSSSSTHPDGVTTANATSDLFPTTDPAVDGDDCLHDCETCTVHLPKGFKIDEDDQLYGKVNGWATHLIVATGKNDWKKEVGDEKGSVMEAVVREGVERGNGKLMLSASNMPLPDHDAYPRTDPANPNTKQDANATTVLLLPAFNLISNVTPASVPHLLAHHIDSAPTTTSPLPLPTPTMPTSTLPHNPTPPLPIHDTLSTTPSPHNALILLCSQRTRDARCGQSAPLLRREFERHLRARGLYRDVHDARPGGVAVVFISHVGGHKYSANCMVYRRAGAFASVVPQEDGRERDTVVGVPEKGSDGRPTREEARQGIRKVSEGAGAAQCIWLARVRPEDCENIVRYTVLQGKVVKPERQLRGGFDRAAGVVSW